jgi:hypothetical protein
MRDWWGRRRRAAKIAIAAVVALVAMSVIVSIAGAPRGVSSQSTPAASPSATAILEILAPRDGAVVTTSSVQVIGTAPRGSAITQDVSFGPDKHTAAASTGRWVMTIDLDAGDNDLVFRIGSDRRTAVTIRVTRASASSSPSRSPLEVVTPADGAVVTTSSVQVSGTAPAGSEVVHDVSFAPDKRTTADSSGHWVMSVDLDMGNNDLAFRIGSQRDTTVTVRVMRAVPSPTPSRAPSPLATVSPSPRPTFTAAPTPSTVTVIEDQPGDLGDENQRDVAGPGYADIVEVAVKNEGDEWLLSIFVDGDIMWKDPYHEPLYYGFWLDTNADGYPDYTLSLENDVDPNAWIGSLFSFEQSYTYAGYEFPGTALPVARSAVIRVKADAIGNPSELAAAATIERAVWRDPQNDPLNLVETFDYAPDTQYPDDDPDWIRVRRR